MGSSEHRISAVGLAIVLGGLAADPLAALAQEAPLHRSPAERQVVVQLAYTLGEAHALRRLCAGPADGLWYGRMERLEAQEASDEGFRSRLVESFNAGFASRAAQYPVCGPASEAAERRVAAKGGVLARRLAADAPG